MLPKQGTEYFCNVTSSPDQRAAGDGLGTYDVMYNGKSILYGP